MEKRKKLPLTVFALGLTSLFTDAATEMIYPLIPIFVAALGSGALMLGVIEGTAESTAALLKLFSGVWSDKLGKRKLFVLIGYTISSLFRPLTGFVAAAWQIVAIRMVDRVGKGIRTSPRDALIAAAAPPEIRGRAFGFHRAMDHSGAVIGPLLALGAMAMLILGFGLRRPLPLLRYTFALALIPGVLAVLTLIFLVKEPKTTVPSANRFRLSLKPFDRNFKRYLLIVLIFTLGNSPDAFLLFRAREAIHQNTELIAWFSRAPLFGSLVQVFEGAEARLNVIDILFLPLIWAFFHVIKVMFATALGALSDRTGRKRVILIGWAIYAAVYGCFAFLDRLPNALQIEATFTLFAVYALYYSFTEGAEKALVADLTPTDLRGSAFGLYHFTVGTAALPAGVIFGWLYHQYRAQAAFGFGAGLALTAMVMMGLMIRE